MRAGSGRRGAPRGHRAHRTASGDACRAGCAEEPHDAATRLGRRLAAAGWPTLLDALSAPEESWPAIEAVVGGELESALLWADADPRAESARHAAPHAPARARPRGDDGRRGGARRGGAERTLADWVGSGDAPARLPTTAVAPDLDALLAGWRACRPAGARSPPTAISPTRAAFVLRGRGDPPGGAARAHARRRDLASAVGQMDDVARSAQTAAHAATERLRNARDAHLAAREAGDDAEAGLRRLRADFDAAVATHARLAERLDPPRGGARAGAADGGGPRARRPRPPGRAPGGRGPGPDPSATSAPA